MDNTEKNVAAIAILDTKLNEAIAQIGELKGRFDTFQSSFIRQDVYNIKHEELVKQVAINANEIKNMRKDRWILPTGTLVMGAVIAFLINYAITH